MNGQGSIEDARRYLEKLFGYPKGAFDPGSKILRDIERVNKALGEGFALLHIAPAALQKRIASIHPDKVISEARKLPDEFLKIFQPPTDGYRR